MKNRREARNTEVRYLYLLIYSYLYLLYSYLNLLILLGKTHISRYGIVLMKAPMKASMILVRHFGIKSGTIHNIHWNVSSRNHVWNNHRLYFESVVRSWPKNLYLINKFIFFFNRDFQTILISVLSQTSVQNQNVLETIIYKYEPLRTYQQCPYR